MTEAMKQALVVKFFIMVATKTTRKATTEERKKALQVKWDILSAELRSGNPHHR